MNIVKIARRVIRGVPVWGKISPAIGPQAQKKGIGELALKCLGHFEIERKTCHGKIHLPGGPGAPKERGNNMMIIEDRLENVERELGRQKRRNRWLLAAILLLAGGLIVPAVFETTAFRARTQVARTAKEIRANKFVLEDKNGKERASLLVTGFGSWLSLDDENGETRIGLGIFADDPSLTLYDENGKERFVAGKVVGLSSDGKTIEYPESSLILLGPDGKVIWSAIE